MVITVTMMITVHRQQAIMITGIKITVLEKKQMILMIEVMITEVVVKITLEYRAYYVANFSLTKNLSTCTLNYVAAVKKLVSLTIAKNVISHLP